MSSVDILKIFQTKNIKNEEMFIEEIECFMKKLFIQNESSLTGS